MMDNASTSFSDNMISSCCNGGSFQHGQVKVSSIAGSTFVHPLLQGGSGLKCSFFLDQLMEVLLIV